MTNISRKKKTLNQNHADIFKNSCIYSLLDRFSRRLWTYMEGIGSFYRETLRSTTFDDRINHIYSRKQQISEKVHETYTIT